MNLRYYHYRKCSKGVWTHWCKGCKKHPIYICNTSITNLDVFCVHLMRKIINYDLWKYNFVFQMDLSWIFKAVIRQTIKPHHGCTMVKGTSFSPLLACLSPMDSCCRAQKKPLKSGLQSFFCQSMRSGGIVVAPLLQS